MILQCAIHVSLWSKNLVTLFSGAKRTNYTVKRISLYHIKETNKDTVTVIIDCLY